MNDNTKEKISKSTMVLILVLIITYRIGFSIYPAISSCIKEILTPNIQKEYYVSSTISDENGEVATGIPAEKAYIEPLSKAIALIFMMVIIIFVAKRLLKYLNKRSIYFGGISRVVKTIEVWVIFLGIFVFVFKLNSIDTRYGIYKETLNEQNNLSYYQVEELPVAVDYLQNEKMNKLEKIQMIVLINTDKIVSLFEVILAINGAMVLPLEYCASIQDKKKKLQEYEKMKKDLRSQVIDSVKQDLKKERKRVKKVN